MNQEKLEELDDLTSQVNMDLNILHNALKYTDEELDIAAVSNFAEKIYKTSEKIRHLF